MLNFTRKVGQSIMIGDSITVTVTEVRGRQVRLGIDAPREIRVYREEVFKQIVAENERAARASARNLDQLD